MRARRLYLILLGSITIIILGVIGIVAMGVSVSAGSTSQISSSLAQPPGANLSTGAPTVSTLPITAGPVNVTQTSTPGSLVVNNPTNVAVGEVIKLSDALYSKAGGITLRRTDKPPVLSVDEALDYNAGAPWKKGGLWNGKQITVTVTFGLGSLGSLQADGSWVASFSPPEFNCTAVRKCTPTGKNLQRIENRPMWVIDYDGLQFCGSGSCDNHTVFVVDDVTGTLFYGFGYSTASSAIPTTTLEPAIATNTPVPSNPNVKEIVPGVAVGEVINIPGFSFGYLKLIHIADLPGISSNEATDIVYNKGATWGRGGSFEGRSVTISATFGLATIGEFNAQGAWIGPQKIPIETCTAFKQCSETGITLDRIENRPMWILQYNNLPATAFMPPPYPCQTRQLKCKTHDIAVFAVDVQTKSVLHSWTYSSQELNP